MTDIQHYVVMTSLLRPFDSATDAPLPTFSDVVLASDHLAAVQQAVEAERHRRLGAFEVAAWFADQWYKQGQRDMLARLAEVTDETDSHAGWVYRAGMADAIQDSMQRVEAHGFCTCPAVFNEAHHKTCLQRRIIATIKGDSDGSAR